MRTLLMLALLAAVPMSGCADGGPGIGNGRNDAQMIDSGMDGFAINDSAADVPVVDAGPDGCGALGTPCCDIAGEDGCDGLLVCLPGNTCGACGGAGQPCCGGASCQAGLLCDAGTCGACGAPGLTCCAGDVPCPDGGDCMDGSCVEDIEVDPCMSASRQCDAGSTEDRPCGNCGTQTRGCSESCRWDEWSTCSGEGVCEPGSTTTDGCGACTARTCNDSCEYETTCDTCTCAELTVCSVDTCPPGYHIGETMCLGTCSGFCAEGVNANAVRCVPNCTASFRDCGRTCPEGYFVASRSCEIYMPFQCTEFNCSHPDQNAVECRRL